MRFISRRILLETKPGDSAKVEYVVAAVTGIHFRSFF